MAYKDLRSYLAVLEQEKELVKVSSEVDWNQEIGAITRRVCELRKAAPLFENIKDYPDQRLVGVMMGPGVSTLHSRFALALGLNKNIPPLELIEIVREKLKLRNSPKRVSPSEAPCKEVILKGKDANVLSLPIPWIHDPKIEGGRYIGTWDIVITKDPDTGWVNWGTYRCMAKDEHNLALVLVPGGQHGGKIFAKYQSQNKPMPVALVLGADPMSSIAAMAPLPHNVSEVDLAGGLLGESIPLVKCETIDLEVPATAEIVIEAEVMPNERVQEGPFAEYTGHIHGVNQIFTKPLAKVNCITHRKNPIFTMANMGKPWDDWAVPGSILQSAVAKDWIESHGIAVEAIYHHAPMTAIVVAVKPIPGIINKISSILMSADRFMPLPASGLVFVGADVDVTNLEDVWWAITTRMHPENYHIIRRVPANPLMPYLKPSERLTMESCYWIMDATFPLDWSNEYRLDNTQVVDFRNSWSLEVQEKVIKRWKEYGF